ncbi:uncharacterized protein BDV17DRAFT_141633 [Aspergillus undulatus]|uniref:uncharacterized protein n=1 Tax=Aspergillus undulatus TaxID=1810928 RepID=UPI003CCD86AA
MHQMWGKPEDVLVRRWRDGVFNQTRNARIKRRLPVKPISPSSAIRSSRPSTPHLTAQPRASTQADSTAQPRRVVYGTVLLPCPGGLCHQGAATPHAATSQTGRQRQDQRPGLSRQFSWPPPERRVHPECERQRALCEESQSSRLATCELRRFRSLLSPPGLCTTRAAFSFQPSLPSSSLVDAVVCRSGPRPLVVVSAQTGHLPIRQIPCLSPRLSSLVSYQVAIQVQDALRSPWQKVPTT